MKALVDWLDSRTGIREGIHSIFFKRIPGGAKWRYVWGTVVLFTVAVQFITGIFLWMHYSPSTQTAWESVYYIEHQMTGGSLLRGIHLYTSSAVMILMSIHLLQVIIHGAYKKPREVNYWIGLAMMITLLGMGQTGYLLTWDQRGFQASGVATNIAGATPVVGDGVKAVALGGDNFGHHTLTRFFALHAGVLPAAFVLLLVLHTAVGRRHGLTPAETTGETSKPDGVYWPDQAMRDGLVSLAVIATVVMITLKFPAELGPPADGTVEFNTARPEWYFRFLFQMLKYFQGASGMFIASQVIPGAVMFVLILMPFIGRWKLGHWFNVVFVSSVFIGIGVLTTISFNEDYNSETEKSQHYIADLKLAHAEAERSIELAKMGIPVEGAREQTRRDPLIAGRRLFKQHCASCHSHYNTDAYEPEDGPPLITVVSQNPSAANLYGFGSRDWMEAMLDPEKFKSNDYFGHTIFADGEMAEWLEFTISEELEMLEEDSEKTAFKMKVKAAAWAISGMAKLPYQLEMDKRDQEQLKAGMDVVLNELSCIDCHTIGEEEAGSAPDLTGYGSEEWLTEFIKNPQTERFYYSPDNYDEADKLMPGYARHPENPDLNTLSDEQILLITRWIRRDWPVADDAEE